MSHKIYDMSTMTQNVSPLSHLKLGIEVHGHIHNITKSLDPETRELH